MPLRIDPSNTVVMPIDMQRSMRGVAEEAGDLEQWAKTVKAVERILEAARSSEYAVVHAMITGDSHPAFKYGTSEGNAVMEKIPASKHFEEGCQPLDEEFVAPKARQSVFEGQSKDLQGALSDTHQRIVMMGVWTNCCLIASVQDALRHGYEVIVPREATMDVIHVKRDALKSMARMPGLNVVDTNELLDEMAGIHRPQGPHWLMQGVSRVIQRIKSFA